MTTRTWGYFLTAFGLFLGFYNIGKDPLLLTLPSFSFAVAGVFILIHAERLRWLVLLFLIPPALLGLLMLFLTHGPVFLSSSWIAVPVMTVWHIFQEARLRRKALALWSQHQEEEARRQ